MKNIFIIMVLIFSSKLAYSKESKPTSSEPEPQIQPQKNGERSGSEIKVKVLGMVCAFCAQGIEKKFKAEPSVESVDVNLEKKFVHLKFKKDQTLTKEKITEILKESGFEARFED